MPVAILQDLTVVECATFVTGPYAAALLGNLGAPMAREKSGAGCRVETSLQATLSFIGETAAAICPPAMCQTGRPG